MRSRTSNSVPEQLAVGLGHHQAGDPQGLFLGFGGDEGRQALRFRFLLGVRGSSVMGWLRDRRGG